MGHISPRLAVAGTTLTLLIAAAWFSQADDARAVVNCDTGSASLDSAEMQMLQLVNGARAAAGLPALAVSPNLNRAAAWKSEDSSNSGAGFSHTDSLGRDPTKRAKDCGYAGGAGENIAYGYPSVQATFDAFMSSPGHRANILASFFRVIGIGHSGSSWTLNFGTIDDSNASPPPANTPTPTNTPRPTSTPIPPPPPSKPAQGQPTSPAFAPSPAGPTTAQTPPPAPRRVERPVQDGPGQLALYEGINLVTYPGDAEPVSLALNGLGDRVEWVYAWDDGRWLRYFPGRPDWVNTLTMLEPGEPYYISMTHDALLTY